MILYTSTSGRKPGVVAYETGEDFIIVQFSSAVYKYSYRSCGQKATEKMKQLALTSKGLSTFIAQNNPNYEWRKD